ncbi:hypothetical protein F0562_014126 [Nyssa sinensis]|uniref:Rapid alkalinization factor 1 n=1 Tax=Nyssa sinensis TaxID=561372 RepID=A0A5J4ZPK5_9ASTE|nr:hypothetical protein F0562_014126 [Nyssa sinensis]
MGFRLGLIVLLLALAMVAESSYDINRDSSVAHFDLDSLRSRGSGSIASSTGKVGDFINDAEEMMLDSEASRRVLAGQRFISYGALKANNVPCNRRGASYYNCNKRGKANPYKRGCSYITKCARINVNRYCEM